MAQTPWQTWYELSKPKKDILLLALRKAVLWEQLHDGSEENIADFTELIRRMEKWPGDA